MKTAIMIANIDRAIEELRQEHARKGTAYKYEAFERHYVDGLPYEQAWDIPIVYISSKGSLAALTAEEWRRCALADLIVCACVHGTEPVERDGVRAVRIGEILEAPAADRKIL